MKHYFLIFFCFLSTWSAYAQFSLKGETQRYFYAQNPNQKIQIDTGIVDFEEYNFEYTPEWEYFNTSIIGTAQQKLSFSWNKKKGFEDGNVFFNNYKYNINNLRYFETEKYPFSEIFYAIGRRYEQRVNLRHAQNIKNRFKFALELQGLSGAGLFNRDQKTRNFGLSFYGIYASKNNKYKLEADLVYSAIKVNEIGGIVEDVLTDKKPNKQFYSIYLNDAINKHSDFAVQIKNSYGFGFTRIDSINDTLKVKHFYPVFKLKHSLGTNLVRQKYSDFAPDSSFYNSFYQNKDSLVYNLRYHNIPHRLSFEYLGTKNTDSVSYHNVEAELAIQHNNLEIWQNGFEKTYNNVMLEAEVRSNRNLNTAIQYKVNTALFVAGYNTLDVSAEGKVSYRFGKFGTLGATLFYENKSPSWIESFYHSSELTWDNTSFKKKQVVETTLSYHLPKHKLKIAAQVDFLNRYIYFNTDAKPIQTDAKITYWNIYAQKDSKWKIWHWDNFIGYQFTNHPEILPLPALYLKTSLYASFPLFKKNMLLSTGFDLRYNTPFQARAWNPVTAQFYVQDIRKMKFTPVLDVFVSGKIKSLRFYVKMNYVNEGLFVRNNYKALNFPSNGRTFSIGLSWRFFE